MRSNDDANELVSIDAMPAGLFGERAQAVLRQAHLGEQRRLRLHADARVARADVEQVGVRLVQLDVFARQPHEPARIDREDIDVRPRGRRNGVLHRAEHVRRVVRGEDVVARDSRCLR